MRKVLRVRGSGFRTPHVAHRRLIRLAPSVSAQVSSDWLHLAMRKQLKFLALAAFAVLMACTARAANVDYLVITPASCSNAFQVLANHRASFDRLSTKVITTEWIYANTNYTGIKPSGGTDNQTRIRQCIDDFVRHSNTLYVVLGGDDTLIPVREFVTYEWTISAQYARQYAPFDLYYAGLDGTWDSNTNNNYGEDGEAGNDYAADVWLGRIPVRNSSQATDYVNKVLNYDGHPAEIFKLAGKFMMGGHTLWNRYTGDSRPSDLLNDGHRQFRDALHPEVDDSEFCIRQYYRDYVQANGWNAETVGCIFSTLTSWDGANNSGWYDAGAGNMITRLGEGWNMLAIFTHGSASSSGWGTESTKFDPGHAAAVTCRVNFIYTSSCVTANFANQEPCLSEAWVRNANSGAAAGAMAYLGCSADGWGGTSDRFYQKWLLRVYRDKKSSLGEAFTLHKTDAMGANPYYTTKSVGLGTSLQGDPGVSIVISRPKFSVTALHAVVSGTNATGFTISRTNTVFGDVTVAYTLSGTAAAGSDYTTAPAGTNGSVVISNGLSSVTVAVYPGFVAIDRTITLALACPSECTLATNSTATITLTGCGAATLETLAATGLTPTSATLQGKLWNGTGKVFTVSAFWNTVNGGTNAALWTNSAYVGAWTNVGSTNFACPVSGLSPLTTYYFTFRGTNATTTLWAYNALSFTTRGPPAVNNSTGAVPAIGGARLNGNLVSDGGAATTVYTYWGDNDGGTSKGSWDYVITNGVVGQGVFSTNTPSTLLYGRLYYYRTYATNANGHAWASSTANFTTLRPLSGFQYRAGLLAGSTTGSGQDWTTPNPGTATNMGPELAKTQAKPPWYDNFTVIYTGEIYFNGADYQFRESIDDNVHLVIDGAAVINNTTWNDTSTSPVITKPAGWYTFDLRMGNGGGGAGYVNINPGFQYTTNAGATWAYPEDGGAMNLFRYTNSASVPLPGVGITNVPAGGVTHTSALLKATLSCTGAVYDVYAHWGTSNGGTNAAAWTHSAFVGACENVLSANISYMATGLTPGKTYSFTFRGANAAETLWATNVLSFATASDLTGVDIQNLAASDITASAATLQGRFSSGTNILTAVSVYWGAVNGGTNAGAWAHVAAVGSYTLIGSTNLAYNTGNSLSPETTYYYAFRATHAETTVWAQPSTMFYTAGPPAVNNGSGATSYVGYATLRGNLVSDGGTPTTVYTYWGDNDGGISQGSWDHVMTNGVMGVGAFETNTPPILLYGKPYYYRTYASNAHGAVWAPSTAGFLTAKEESTFGEETGWSYTNWTGDADSGVSSNDSYTLAVNLGGSAVSVNGVAFQASALSGTNFTIGGSVSTTSDGANNVAGALADQFIYNGNPRTVTLGNLTPGKRYVTTFFSVGWEASGRVQTFTSGADSLVLDQDRYGDNNGIRISYVFDADASGSRSFTITPAGGNTFHLYALANRLAAGGGSSLYLANAPATAVSNSSATLKAALGCTGAVYDVYAHWGTVNGGTNAAVWIHSVYAGSWTNLASTNISCLATDLSPNTTYFFTFRGSNAAEMLWATNVLSLTTTAGEAPNMTLTVVSAYGGQKPGTTVTNSGTALSCYLTNAPVVNGTTQYVANGGAVVGNAYTQVSPTNITLTLTNNATLTWRWATNYWLALNVNGQGTVNRTNGWQAAGGNVAITATASNYWSFAGWSGQTNGCGMAGNVITAAMSQARSIAASFTAILATNGVPQWWLAQNGWTSDFDAVALLDSDGDGMKNWAEYAAGTDPNSAGSCLAITNAVRQSGTNCVFGWPSVAGKFYGVLRATNLMGSWTAIRTNLAATPPANVCTDAPPAEAGGVFYRVKVE